MMTESGTQDQIAGTGPNDALDTDWVPEFGSGPLRAVSFETAETLAAVVHQGIVPPAPDGAAYGRAAQAAFRLAFVMAELNPGWVHYAQHGQIWSDRAGEVGS